MVMTIMSSIVPLRRGDRMHLDLVVGSPKTDGLEEIQTILKTISKNGVSKIIFCLKKSPKKFSQIMFETRLNPGVLGRHLKSLMELKVVSKNGEYYYLTEAGVSVLNILEEFKKLAEILKVSK